LINLIPYHCVDRRWPDEAKCGRADEIQRLTFEADGLACTTAARRL